MKKFIFTVTAGRTGTMFLTELFRANFPDATVHHEMLGWDHFGVNTPDVSHFTQFNSRGNTPAVQAFWEQKLERIAADPADLYLESSHLLAKAGLLENIAPLTRAGEVHVLLLRRDILKSVLSHLSRGDFNNIGSVWLWCLDPTYPRNILPADKFMRGGMESVCLWYAFEMAVRQEYYRLILADRERVRVHDAELGEITTEAGARTLFGALGLPLPEAVAIPPPQNVHAANIQFPAEKVAQFRRDIDGLNFNPVPLARDFVASGKRL